MRHERDYIERTIATVRQHKGHMNAWPSWANILADEIERLWESYEPGKPVINDGLWVADDAYPEDLHDD